LEALSEGVNGANDTIEQISFQLSNTDGEFHSHTDQTANKQDSTARD